MSERSEHCDTDVSLNKLSQLREAAELFASRKAENDKGGRVYPVKVHGFQLARAQFRNAADPDTIIALLDALEAAERALTPWLNGEVPLAPTPNAERALAKIASLKGES